MDSLLRRHDARRGRLGIIFGTAFLACACQSGGPARDSSPAPIGLDTAGASYTLDAAASELYVLVYRAGPFARLGHNHVIAARDLVGRLSLAPGTEEMTFELLLAVDGFDVDPPELRERFGEDFASAPTQSDVVGTRANMLGPALLDAAAFPYVRIAGRIDGSDPGVARIEVAIKDTVAQLTVPVVVSLSPDRVAAQGQLEVDHARLGLTPFSVMLGALRVAETMRVVFSLVASREART